MPTTVLHAPPPKITEPLGEQVIELPNPMKQEDIIKPPLIARFLPLAMMILMVFMFAIMLSTGTRQMSPYMMMGPMMMMMSVLGMVGLGNSGAGGIAEVNIERKNFLNNLQQWRDVAHHNGAIVHRIQVTNFPNPMALLGLVGGDNMWKSAPTTTEEAAPDTDLTLNPYGFARVGVGLVPMEPAIKQADSLEIMENLEPVTALSHFTFRDAQSVVANSPIGFNLVQDSVYAFRGESGEKRLGLARAMITSLAYNHVPGAFQIGIISDRAESEWGWMKWLPHTQDTTSGVENTPRLAWDSLGSFMLSRKFDIDQRIATRDQNIDDNGTYLGTQLVIFVDMPNTQLQWLPQMERDIPGVTFVLVRFDSEQMSQQDNLLHIKKNGKLSTPEKEDFADADYLSLTNARRVASMMSRFRPEGFGQVSGADARKAATKIVRIPTMFDALEIDDIDEYDPRVVWKKNAYTESFEAPLGTGYDPKSADSVRNPNIVTLNIQEASRKGDGSHGAIQGMTGTGKSYLLKGFVAQLCTVYGPDKLNFVLMDFKGGSTFFGFEKLPHVRANISNLKESTELVVRTVDVLRGELDYRQELFNRYKTGDILDYRKEYAARMERGDNSMPVLPDLVVLIDEFRQYMAKNKESLKVIFEIGAVGRSLGIHCIPCSQFLDESLIGEFKNHLSWGISLKVQESAGAQLVVKNSSRPLALKDGLGQALLYKKGELSDFRGFDVRAPYVRKVRKEEKRKRNIEQAAASIGKFTLMNPYVDIFADEGSPAQVIEEPNVDGREQLDALLTVLTDEKYLGYTTLRQMWLPSLKTPMSLLDVDYEIDPRPSRGIVIRMGDTDSPLTHQRVPFNVDLTTSSPHLVIAGAPKSGRSTTVQTLCSSANLRYAPSELSFYLVEMSGARLSEVENLPNVGGYAVRSDREMIDRFFGEFTNIRQLRLDIMGTQRIDIDTYLERKANGTLNDPRAIEDHYGHMALVIDGLPSLMQEDEDFKTTATWKDLCRDGAAVGQHLIVTTNNTESELHYSFAQFFPNRIYLRVDDVSGSYALRGVPREILESLPLNQPGRCLDAARDLHARIMLPLLRDVPSTGELNEAGEKIYDTSRSYADLIREDTELALDNAKEMGLALAHRIEPAPEILPYDTMYNVFNQLPKPEYRHHRIFPAGVDMSTVRLVEYPTRDARNSGAIIAGDNESGKSTVIRSIIQTITREYTPDEAKVVIFDSKFELMDERNFLVDRGFMNTSNYITSRDKATTVIERIAHTVKENTPDLENSTRSDLERRSWMDGKPELFILIDGYNNFGPPSSYAASIFDPLIAALKDNELGGVHLFITTPSQKFMNIVESDKLFEVMRLQNMPVVLLSGSKAEGSLFGHGGPKFRPRRKGQATVYDVSRSSWVEAQLAYVPRMEL